MYKAAIRTPRKTVVALAAGTALAALAPDAGAVAYTWTTGDFPGDSAVPGGLLMSTDTLDIVSGGTKRFNGSVLVNQGLVRWQADNLQGGNAATIDNSGTWEAMSDNAMTSNFGGVPVFTNTGVFRKSGGTGTTTMGWRFVNNGGTIDAQTGTVNFSSGNVEFNGGTSFTGAGSVRVGANASFAGNITSDNLTLAAGTFTGNAAVLAGGTGTSGQVVWSGGDIVGNWQNGASSTVTATDGANKRLNTANVVNDGTVVWNSAATLQVGNASSFTNNGLYEARASHTVNAVLGGLPTFTNTSSGTVRADAGQTLTIGGGSSLAFVNAGGTLDAEAGGAIVYSTSNLRFEDGTTFTGSGLHSVSRNATFVGTSTASGNLVLEHGTLTGGDGTPGSQAVLAGAATWSGGDLAGGWRIAGGTTLTGSDGSNKRINGASLVNDGTLAWNSADPLQMGNAASITNNGVIDIATDADVVHAFGGQPTLDNRGLIVKSGGAGETSFANSLMLANEGTIDVRTGSVRLPNGFANAGTLTGSGTFASNTITNDGHVAPGESPGTLAIDGNFVQSAAGVFDVELESLGSTDLLTVSGTASLDGTLALHCWAACSFAVGDEIVILDSAGDLGGTFAAMTMTGFGTGAFDVIYDTAGDRVLLAVIEAVTPVPEPATPLLWLGGAGLLAFVSRRRRNRT